MTTNMKPIRQNRESFNAANEIEDELPVAEIYRRAELERANRPWGSPEDTPKAVTFDGVRIGGVRRRDFRTGRND